MPDEGIRSVYIHVPFCAHKCSYCAFYSEVPRAAWVDRYVAALVLELERTLPRLAVRTIYFGGGTPTLMNVRQWTRILKAMEHPGLAGVSEWTVECNPGTLTPDKARLLRDHGVNRVSLGVQSLDEALLERLGRIHTRGMVFKAFEMLRQVGFDNINLDFMFALPTQTMDIWEATLTEGLALGSEHLSCYEVIYEKDTPLFQQLKSRQISTDEDLSCEMYERLMELAGQHGYRQYEIANFARDDRESQGGPVPSHACHHNVNYWRGRAYAGLGPSAAGFVDGVRTRNFSNTAVYCKRLESGENPVEMTDRLEPRARAGEIAAFGLRMNQGWGFEEFLAITGFDMRQEWKSEMEQLVARGWAVWDTDCFRLTGEGLRFADAAAIEFLS